jgi:hypothetical protein
MRAASGHCQYDTYRFPHLGQVVALEQIGTDRDRWASYTQNFSAAQNTLYAGYPWRFSHFRKTAGYANQPLDGIWARSPYLHIGSVPTLRDLLEPAANRPKKSYRGSDIFGYCQGGLPHRRLRLGTGGPVSLRHVRARQFNSGHEERPSEPSCRPPIKTPSWSHETL